MMEYTGKKMFYPFDIVFKFVISDLNDCSSHQNVN